MFRGYPDMSVISYAFLKGMRMSFKGVVLCVCLCVYVCVCVCVCVCVREFSVTSSSFCINLIQFSSIVSMKLNSRSFTVSQHSVHNMYYRELNGIINGDIQMDSNDSSLRHN